MSSYYAEHLASNPKNLIAITGFQAEGTPGRALLDLVEAGESTDRVWKLNNGVSVPVKCQVKRYSLSAHADSKELLELVEKVQPRKLFLVHGDKKARGKLSKSVRKACPAVDVKRPKNGRAYTVRKRIGIGGGRKLSSDRILHEVAAFVRKMEWQGPFRVRELAEIWFGTEGITEIVVKFVEWCLFLDREFFRRGSNNLFYLR